MGRMRPSGLPSARQSIHHAANQLPRPRVKHLAFFQFKDTCTPEDVAGVWRIIEALPRQIPGILDLTWGVNTSPEGLSEGFTHSFVMLFENAAARDAYLPHPIHAAAAAAVLKLLAQVVVCDHECV